MTTIVVGKQVSTTYPYGRLQCTMTFDIEFKKGKGFRSCMQSTNPKTNRLNAPKYSTYSNFMYMVKDEQGHINFMGLNIHGLKDVERFIKLISENEFSFTVDQSQELWAHIITVIKISLGYCLSRKFEGVTKEQVLSCAKLGELIKLYGAFSDINELKNVGFSTVELGKLVENPL